MKQSLRNLTILVIGAGPGGLTFAIKARQLGAKITVIEKADHPVKSDSGYTNRSFNLTLNSVGRKIIGRDLLEGSIDLCGRAIHNFQGTGAVKYSSAPENTKDEDLLTSIPRPILRQNLVLEAEKNGVELYFNCDAKKIDTNLGIVTVEIDETEKDMTADLVVIADGLHSLTDSILENDIKGTLGLKIDPLKYITIKLQKNIAKGLSLHHIHFWHNPTKTSVAIGLPNKDETVSILLVSAFSGVGGDDTPFPDEKSSRDRMLAEFPEIFEMDPEILEQVVGRKQGRFFYKSISDYILGDKTTVIGDASSAAPPWAGFGANTAIYSADALVRYLSGYDGDIKSALRGFQKHKKLLAEHVINYADKHGEFLNKKVADNPDDRPIAPVLGQIINKVREESDVPENVELLKF